MYPRLEININKLKENAEIVASICRKNNIDVAMVTKSYCAIKDIAQELASEVDYIADSRIQNLKNLKEIDIPKILIRIPMISEVKDVIKYSDISFNSEIKTIKKLNDVAGENQITHKIVLMVDLGDLREGYFEEEDLFNAVGEVLKLENIKLIGLATNLTCYGAIIPSEDNLGRLVELSKKIEKKFDIKLDFISGGNSSSIHLLQSGKMPKKITNLRPGEAIVLGRETAYGNQIEGAHIDTFKLVCEIVEIKEKPSIPIGESGVDAFGNKPTYEDRGIRTRAIVGIGKQDIDIDSIEPTDSEAIILGASSDHMILDVTDSNNEYRIGDKIEFLLSYGGLMAATTSKYVHKAIIY